MIFCVITLGTFLPPNLFIVVTLADSLRLVDQLQNIAGAHGVPIAPNNPPSHTGTHHHGHTTNSTSSSQSTSRPISRPMSTETINSKGGSKKLPPHLKGTFKPIFDGTYYHSMNVITYSSMVWVIDYFLIFFSFLPYFDYFSHVYCYAFGYVIVINNDGLII